MLRFSITTLIILTVWAALIVNANLNSSRIRASRLRTATVIKPLWRTEKDNTSLQSRIKKEQPAQLRNSSQIQTLNDFEQGLVEALQRYIEANADVRPIPGKISIRKIPKGKNTFHIFVPSGLSARLQLELHPQAVTLFHTRYTGSGSETTRSTPIDFELQKINEGKPFVMPLQPGPNRLSMVYQPKPGLPGQATEKPTSEADRRARTRFEFIIRAGQDSTVLLETDRPKAGFSVADPSGLDSYDQVDIGPGSRSLMTCRSPTWPFRLEAKLVIEETVNE